MVDPDKAFRHSDDQIQKAFERVLLDYARNKASLLSPRFAIIGGQPGAGKSTVITLINKKFNPDKQPVVINLDDLRGYLDFEKDIFKKYPFELAFYTNEDAWKLTDQLLCHARKNRNNGLYETTLKTVNPIELIIKTFQAEKYAVDLHALAVNAKSSVQGIYERYEYQLAIQPTARWTPIDFHDEAYRLFPENVQQLEASSNLSSIAVYRRDGTILYQKARAQMTKDGSSRAILAERDAAWEQKNKTRLVQKWTDIVDAIESRDGPKPDWYIEKACEFKREAELFQHSRLAQPSEAPDINKLVEHTHHHIFTSTDGGKSLTCYEKKNSPNITLPSRPKGYWAPLLAQNRPVVR